MKKMMWMWCLVAAFGLSVNFACSDSNDDPTPDPTPVNPTADSVVIPTSTFVIPAVGGTQTVIYQASAVPTITCPQAWVTISDVTKTSAKIAVAANETTAERTATISVKVGTVTKTITVSQAAKDVVVDLDTCSVSPTTLSIEAAGGNVEFVTTTNRAFTVTSNNTAWLTVTSDGRAVASYTAVLAVAANTATESREGTVTIHFTEGSAKDLVVTVTQAAAAVTPVPSIEMLNVAVEMTTDETTKSVAIPTELASKLGVDDVAAAISEESVTYRGLMADLTTYYTVDGAYPAYTTNGPCGHWYNTDGDVISWGTPDPNGTGAERLAYIEGDGAAFNLGLGKTFAEGDSFVIAGAYVKGETIIGVKYTVSIVAAPAVPALDVTPDYTIQASLAFNTAWKTVSWSLADEEIASEIETTLGVDNLEDAIAEGTVMVTGFQADGTFYGTGDVTADHTGNSGFWFTADGVVTTYGQKCGICAELSETLTTGTMCMYPSGIEVGDVLKGYYVYYTDAENMVIVELECTIDPEPAPETYTEVGDVYTATFELSLAEGYSQSGSYSIEESIVDIEADLGAEINIVLLQKTTDAGNVYVAWTETDGWYGLNGAITWGTESIACVKPNVDGTFAFVGCKDDVAIVGDAPVARFLYANSESKNGVVVEITCNIGE